MRPARAPNPSFLPEWKQLLPLVAVLCLPCTGLRADEIHVDGSCDLGDAIEAANTDTSVAGCAHDGVAGADTLVLDVDVVLSAADTVRSTELGGAHAGLPDVTTEITIEAGAASRIERDTAFGCDDADQVDELRLLNVSGGALTLDSLTLVNGCADAGGAVYVQDGSLTVVGSTLRNHTAKSASVSHGGAIYGTVTSVISISDSTFEDNLAASSPETSHSRGGAVYSLGTLTELTRSEFNRNVAGSHQAEGGAIFLDSAAPIDWSDLVFRENRSGGSTWFAYGGAVVIDGLGPASRLERALFVGNQALGGFDGSTRGLDAEGGAMVLYAALALVDVSFVDNLVQGGDGTTDFGGDAFGGAVMFDGDEGLERQNLTFSGNRAVGGDSVSGDAGDAFGGAAFFWYGPGLDHTTVTGNRAVAGSSGTGPGIAEGGGIWVDAYPQFEVISSVFEDNATVVDGVVSADDCYLDGTTFTSLGYNVVSAPGNCPFGAAGDQITSTPSLLPLNDYGCTTPLPDGSCLLTHPVAIESPAHDQGSCTGTGSTADARGLARPWDDPAVANADDGCDAGAYESRDLDDDGLDDAYAAVPIFEDGFESGDTAAWSIAFP